MTCSRGNPRQVLFALGLVLIVFGGNDAIAQTPPEPRSSQDAWAAYNAEKKEEFAAAGLEALIPVVGHAYVGDARRGLLPLAVSGGGLALLIIGAGDVDTSLMSIGWLTYLGGRVWGVVSALEAAKEHNAAIRTRLRLSVAPAEYSDGVEFKFSFADPFRR